MATSTETMHAENNELDGLTTREVAERRASRDINVAGARPGRSYVQIVRQNMFTFLNLLIFGVSAILAPPERRSQQ